jgi:hypothetical protein
MASGAVFPISDEAKVGGFDLSCALVVPLIVVMSVAMKLLNFGLPLLHK